MKFTFLSTERNGVPVGRGVVRFSLLFLVPFWLMIVYWLLSRYGSVTSSTAALLTGSLVLLAGINSLSWLVALFNTARQLRRIQLRIAVPAKSGLSESLSLRGTQHSFISHLVVITCYKEPLELIAATISSLAAQSDASRMRVLVGFEERTPALRHKQNELRALFASSFLDFQTIEHLAGVPGEIPGKCSNVNFSVRAAVHAWRLDDPAVVQSVILTTCDADNLFHCDHFRDLRVKFVDNPNRHRTIWQAPLFYDWNLEKSSFFTRNTGHMRTMFLCGLLVPLNINSMSIQSLSLALCVRGDYFHPAYQMEDILNAVRWMTEISQSIRIAPLDLPVLSGPTSGETIWKEANEWISQARRWTIGAAEVFHYFLARAKRLPKRVSASWGTAFFYYYAVYLPTGSLIPLVWLSRGGFGVMASTAWSGLTTLQDKLMAIILVCRFSAIVLLHLLRCWWAGLLPSREKVSVGRRFLDLVSHPLCQIGYSLISIWSIHVLAVKGRSVCGHKPAEKSELINASALRRQ